MRQLCHTVTVLNKLTTPYYVLPFDSAPQVYNSSSQHPEGTPGHFYRLRLADLEVPFIAGPGTAATELISILLAELAAPFANRLIGHDDSTFKQQLFDIAEAEAKPKVQPHRVADDFRRKAVVLISLAG
jgi:hypothetical protein